MSKIVNKRKRNIISLDTKLGVIERLKEGLSMAVVAKEFGIGKSTVHDIKKIEKDLVNWGDSDNNNEDDPKPKMVYIKHEKLEDAVFKWCHQEIEEGRECRDADIRRVAERFAECIGVANLAPLSGGWLSRFKKKFNLKNLGEDILNHCIFPLNHGLQVYTEEGTDPDDVPEESNVPASNENSSEADLQNDHRDPLDSEGFIKEAWSLCNSKHEGPASCTTVSEKKFKMPEDSTKGVKEEPNDCDVTDDSSCSPAAPSSASFSTSPEKVFSDHENCYKGILMDCLSNAKQDCLSETPPSLTRTPKFNNSNQKLRNNSVTTGVTFSMTFDDKVSSLKETNKNRFSDKEEYGLMINSLINEMDLTQQVLAKFYILKIIDMGKKRYLSPSGVVL